MNQNVYSKELSKLSKILFSIDNKKELHDFLEDILTPQEIIWISERISLCRELLKGETQRYISSKLWISITTVNRWSRMLQFGTKALSNVLKRFI